MPPERNFLFIFSVLAGRVFSLSHMIFCLIPPPTCQGHGFNIFMVLRGRWLSSAPHHCRQGCIAVFLQQQFNISLQEHSAHGQTSLQGQLAWTEELLGAATSSQCDLGMPMLLL